MPLPSCALCFINSFLHFLFDWRMIALQSSVGFCCRAKWNSCKNIQIPWLLSLPPTASTPLVITEPRAELPWLYSSFPLAACFPRAAVCIFQRYFFRASHFLLPLMAQLVKNPPAMWFNPGFDLWVGKIPLEKGMATHCSIQAWRMPWTEEPGGLQSMGSWRVGHDWATGNPWARHT